MNIAITGSSGFIGSALTARLEREGHAVTRVRRGDRSDPTAHWNPTEGWVREGALEGIDAVVHLSGASIVAKRWSEARKRELRAARIDSARLLIDHLATLSARPAVFVSASAIGYYGSRGDEPLAEDARAGSGFLADLVRDWEAETARAAGMGMRVVNARFGVTIDRHGELMARVLPLFKRGVGGRLGSGKQWLSWVMVEDVARALLFALQNESLSGPVNVVAPEPVTNREFTRALGRAIHRPALFPAPAPALRLVLGRERANETALASQRVVPRKLLDAGFTFVYPNIERAMAAMFG